MKRVLRSVAIAVAVTATALGITYAALIAAMYLFHPPHVDPPVFIKVKVTITVTQPGAQHKDTP